MIVVVIDPGNFIKIISVLQGHRLFLYAIGEKMMTDYSSKIKFYILNSSITTFPTEMSSAQSSDEEHVLI